MKRVLMVAYHFPPVQGSSGVQRTLKFCQYLPAYGWEPLVVTAHTRAYPRVCDDQMSEIPVSSIVRRAFALDTARHISIAGRYPKFLALPDRWVSWVPDGVISGLRLIRRYQPRVIWSTYPIASAHLIACWLHRISGLPWVADFRDSMTEETFPSDPTKRRVFRFIEKRAIENCTAAVFTTPGAIEMYANRYPQIDAQRYVEIQNGFDEENFRLAEKLTANIPTANDEHSITLVHSGLLYPSERDPRAFFKALANLVVQGKVSSSRLTVVLRATGYDEHYAPMLKEIGIDALVHLEPPTSYAHALAEMLRADGLLLFQASNCNHQIPAKLYEYLRARKPIFALTDPEGNTAQVLQEAKIDTIARLDSSEDIEQKFSDFLASLMRGNAPTASAETVLAHTRESRARELAALFSRIIRARG